MSEMQTLDQGGDRKSVQELSGKVMTLADWAVLGVFIAWLVVGWCMTGQETVI